MKFKDLFTSVTDTLSEALITFGGKAYPKYGNIVILAGGAGSGKGFVTKNLLGLEGKILDVDQLKELALSSTKIKSRILKELNVDLADLKLKNPEDVSLLRDLLNKINIEDRKKQALFSSILAGNPEVKPNIIFDVTLRNISKLDTIVSDVSKLGYKPENIHIVWVVNDVQIALKQNKERKRTLKDDILIDTHEGAALTMRKIISMGDNIKKYMNGSIVLAFNKRGIDSGFEKSKNGGKYIINANYIVVKEKGVSINPGKINNVILAKIQRYVPKSLTWSKI